MNLLGKNGHDLPRILVWLPSQSLNHPKGMAQTEFLDVFLVLLAFAILLQRLPALFGIPSEHFKPFTEGWPFLGVEMRGLVNLSGTLNDEANVSVT